MPARNPKYIPEAQRIVRAFGMPCTPALCDPLSMLLATIYQEKDNQIRQLVAALGMLRGIIPSTTGEHPRDDQLFQDAERLVSVVVVCQRQIEAIEAIVGKPAGDESLAQRVEGAIRGN